jgi:hypothetical protein
LGRLFSRIEASDLAVALQEAERQRKKPIESDTVITKARRIKRRVRSE